jgi:superfamily II DNA or RNA helicase
VPAHITIQYHDSSHIKIIGDPETKEILNDYFTMPAKNFWFNPKFKSGWWDGQIRFYNPTTGLLPFGFYYRLFTFLKKHDIKFKIDSDLKSLLSLEDISDFEQEVEKAMESIEERDYQIRAVKKILKLKRGILEHCTGAGKTIVLYLLSTYFYNKKNIKKIIFVVPTLTLISQTRTSLLKFGIKEKDIGLYYKDEKDTSKYITIGTWQSLTKNKKLLEQADVVIADECHGAKAVEISALLNSCINAIYRIGLTGTMPEHKTEYMTIVGSIGQVIDTVDTHTLIHKEKVLSKAKIIILELNYPKEAHKAIKAEADAEEKKQRDNNQAVVKKHYRIEQKFIEEHEGRKKVFKKLLENEKFHNKNTLILFDTVAFGKSYMEYVEKNHTDKHIYWVEGKVKVDAREKIRQDSNIQDGVLLFATLGTFSTGIDIPKIHNIIFLRIGKSNTRVKQSIGRGLRKHATKKELTIYDFSDILKYSEDHLLKRITIYTKEQYPVDNITVNLNKE